MVATRKFGMKAAVAGLAAMLIGTTGALAGVSTTAVFEPLNDQFSVRWDMEGGGLRRRIVESPTAPGGAALEVSMRRRIDEVWRSRVTVPLVNDIHAGDTVELRVWIRAESPINGLETGNIDLQIVRTSEPYDNIFSENIRPTEEGRYYSVRGVAQADFDADDVVFGANMGYGRQTIQFGSIFINRVESAD
ncbi:hypothetical protein [Maricaulis sp.]|uniref:hypothetical protein n=1 Tax=Maricaulis sp. TaxID=1486257 RepID=UPI0025BFEB2C|nr:hypothetical protein [Maricaulis sp.]